MAARVLKQDEAIKELFRERIREKVKRDKEDLGRRLDEELPSIVSWALKPLAGLVRGAQQWRDSLVGKAGEAVSLASCWLVLPSSWVVVSDLA
ncbi:MAG: hypothetical protein IMW97_00390 [Firmicutes bacterium]|nr:hypothetical protein [Candidatus Fermentithermobacillaceae bacterium]